MRAAVVRAYDQPPVYGTFDTPVPAGEEKLVHVSAAGLHQIVRSLASGSHYGSTGQLPFVPGVDGAGRLEDGTRVYFGAARPPFGSFAELSLASPVILIPLPDALDATTAAAIANPGMSSRMALIRAGFEAGQNVLILGATGTSGRLAVQIARRLGAGRIVAVARNQEKLKALTALGADELIALDQPSDALLANLRASFAANKVDVVLDYLWGEPAEAVLGAISQKGLKTANGRVRFIQIGSMAGQKIEFPAAALRSSGLELLGSGFGAASFQQIAAAIAEFFAMAAAQPFDFAYKAAPLSEIAHLWNEKSDTRLVFQP